MTKQFCKNVKSVCKEKGLKLGEAENKCGCSAGYIARTLANSSSMPLGTALKFCAVLGESIEDMCRLDYETYYEQKAVELQIETLQKEIAVLQDRLQQNQTRCINEKE